MHSHFKTMVIHPTLPVTEPLSLGNKIRQSSLLKQNGTGNTLVYIDFEKENKNKLGYYFSQDLIYSFIKQLNRFPLHICTFSSLSQIKVLIFFSFLMPIVWLLPRHQLLGRNTLYPQRVQGRHMVDYHTKFSGLILEKMYY